MCLISSFHPSICSCQRTHYDQGRFRQFQFQLEGNGRFRVMSVSSRGARVPACAASGNRPADVALRHRGARRENRCGNCRGALICAGRNHLLLFLSVPTVVGTCRARFGVIFLPSRCCCCSFMPSDTSPEVISMIVFRDNQHQLIGNVMSSDICSQDQCAPPCHFVFHGIGCIDE